VDKKGCSFIFFTITLVLVVYSSPYATFAVNPNNPHFFVNNGKPLFLITEGPSFEFESEGHYSGLKRDGFNHKHVRLMTNFGRSNSVYNGSINGGWNQPDWNELKDNVRWAYERDIIIGVTLWNTGFFEERTFFQNECRGWCSSYYNERNGGPIPENVDGKDGLYSFDNYGEEITEPYSANWPWQKRNQYHQESLVKKYLAELGDFPNVYYIPMFEFADFWGVGGFNGTNIPTKARQWHQHIGGIIKKYQPERLIATVVSSLDEDDVEIGGWAEIDFLLFEGPTLTGVSTSRDIKKFYWHFNKPLAWMFQYIDTGETPGVNDNDPIGKMREGVIQGVHPATKDGGQRSYALALANFMETIENWCDEPGQEITKESVPTSSEDIGLDLPAGSCKDTYSNNPGPPPVRISKSSLPAALVNNAYTVQINAFGGTGERNWALISGSLPPGIIRTDNVLAGTPIQAGEFTFIIEVTGAQTADTASFTLIVLAGASPATILNVNPSNYTTTILNEQIELYNDRTYKIQLIPQHLLGATLIQTSNDDKASTGLRHLSFEVNEEVDVYLGIAGGGPLSWMQGWTNTGQTVKGSHGPYYYLFLKQFSTGEIVLGGNEGSAANMYTVFVSGKEDPSQVTKKSINIHNDFKIFVSPNPFNSRITISLPSMTYSIDLFVYDLFGRMVKSYSNLPAHSISWDAKGLPNGVYMIKAVRKDRQVFKKIILKK